jgi:hypothetical protein
VLFPVLLLAQNNFDSLLKELDNTVDNYQLYSSRKEGEINKLKENLKQMLQYPKQEIYGKLYDEYKLYQLDSALVYARFSNSRETR